MFQRIFVRSVSRRWLYKKFYIQPWRMQHRSVSNSTMTIIRAHPAAALVDDHTQYVVSGLDACQDVTITATLTEDISSYISHAHYRANSQGTVDLTLSQSLGGSYTGMEPMGLLWAMLPELGSREGIRLVKRDISKPFNVVLSVLPGHQSVAKTSDINYSSVLCHLEHPRTYMGPGVTRTEVTAGRLRGALYLPKGEGPFPGVLDLFGTAGGLIEFRSALFASRGFASYALPFFGYGDLKKTQSWDMEYFEDAVDWLISHPKVKKGGVGAIGVSKGTELVNYMAITKPQVKAAVLINGYHYYSYAEHYKNGVLQPVVWPQAQYLITDPEGLVIEDAYFKTPVPENTLIPIEEAKGASFLFINGEDDRCCKLEHTKILTERLKKHGKSNFEAISYPGTGHLIEPPFTPHARIAYHKLIDTIMLFGGDTKPHAFAQEDSWRRILEFFSKHVDCDSTNATQNPTAHSHL